MYKLWRQSVQYNEAWRQRMKERLTLMVGGLNGKMAALELVTNLLESELHQLSPSPSRLLTLSPLKWPIEQYQLKTLMVMAESVSALPSLHSLQLILQFGCIQLVCVCVHLGSVAGAGDK